MLVIPSPRDCIQSQHDLHQSFETQFQIICSSTSTWPPTRNTQCTRQIACPPTLLPDHSPLRARTGPWVPGAAALAWPHTSDSLRDGRPGPQELPFHKQLRWPWGRRSAGPPPQLPSGSWKQHRSDAGPPRPLSTCWHLSGSGALQGWQSGATRAVPPPGSYSRVPKSRFCGQWPGSVRLAAPVLTERVCDPRGSPPSCHKGASRAPPAPPSRHIGNSAWSPTGINCVSKVCMFARLMEHLLPSLLRNKILQSLRTLVSPLPCTLLSERKIGGKWKIL